MNHYQTTFILNPVLSAEAISETSNSFRDLLNKEESTIIHQTDAKNQDLAYPIKKMHTGLYVDIEFKAPASVVAKLETTYKRNEQILRFLTTKLDKHGVVYKEKQRSNSPDAETSKKEAEAPKQASKTQFTLDQEQKKKYCRFKRFGIKYIDYKNENFLKSFLNDQGKILPRRLTGTSAKYQRKVAHAVKRARILALLPFVTDNFK